MKFLKGKMIVIESRYVRGWEWRERTDYKGAPSERYIIIVVVVFTGLHICQNSLNCTFKLGKLCCKWSTPPFFNTPIHVGLRKTTSSEPLGIDIFALFPNSSCMTQDQRSEIQRKECRIEDPEAATSHPFSCVLCSIPSWWWEWQSFTWYLKLNQLDFE